MKVVCTGDWVAVDPEGSNPHYVRTLLPRRTAFVRSTSSKRSEGQVLATNIDHVVICVSLAAELDLGRIERFLALAMSCSIGEALLHNAADSWESGATCATVKSAYAVSPARSRSVAAPPALHGQSAA
jgi:ribosome biogenesis GTPase